MKGILAGNTSCSCGRLYFKLPFKFSTGSKNPLNSNVLFIVAVSANFQTLALMAKVVFTSDNINTTKILILPPSPKVEVWALWSARPKICFNCENKLTTKWIRDT